MEILLTIALSIITIAAFLAVAVPIAALFWIIIDLAL